MINKKGFVDLVYEMNDRQYTKQSLHEYLDLFLEGMKSALLQEGGVRLSGFGVFDLRKRKMRKNISFDGSDTVIKQKKIPRFRPMESFKNEMN